MIKLGIAQSAVSWSWWPSRLVQVQRLLVETVSPTGVYWFGLVLDGLKLVISDVFVPFSWFFCASRKMHIVMEWSTNLIRNSIKICLKWEWESQTTWNYTPSWQNSLLLSHFVVSKTLSTNKSLSPYQPLFLLRFQYISYLQLLLALGKPGTGWSRTKMDWRNMY